MGLCDSCGITTDTGVPVLDPDLHTRATGTSTGGGLLGGFDTALTAPVWNGTATGLGSVGTVSVTPDVLCVDRSRWAHITIHGSFGVYVDHDLFGDPFTNHWMFRVGVSKLLFPPYTLAPSTLPVQFGSHSPPTGPQRGGMFHNAFIHEEYRVDIPPLVNAPVTLWFQPMVQTSIPTTTPRRFRVTSAGPLRAVIRLYHD